MIVLAFVLCMVLMFTGLPLFVVFAFSAGLYLVYGIGMPLSSVGQLLYAGIFKYTLVAVPLFIFAGSLMVYGGCSGALIRVLNSYLGHVRGGLGLSVVASAAIFSAISASNVATAAAIGTMLIPEMKKAGYPGSYAAALTAGSGSLGNLIPPSLTAIVYCGLIDTSVAKQFLGGVLPGLLMASLLAIASLVICAKRGYGRGPRYSWSERGRATLESLPALFMPVLVLGGIYGGILTTTEAAAAACAYAIVIGFVVYRKLNITLLRKAFEEGVRTTANIYLLVASAILLSKVFTLSGLPQYLASWVTEMNLGPVPFLLMATFILFVLGTVMEPLPIILLSIPIFMSSIYSLGIDPILFGVLLALVVGVAVVSPPIAMVLFVVAGISGERIDLVTKEAWPFIGLQVLVTIMVVLFPPLSTWLPGLGSR